MEGLCGSVGLGIASQCTCTEYFMEYMYSNILAT